MTKENIIEILTSPPAIGTILAVIQEYIYDRKGIYVQIQPPGQFDMNGFMLLQEAYETALEYFQKKFSVCILYSKDGNTVLKVY